MSKKTQNNLEIIIQNNGRLYAHVTSEDHLQKTLDYNTSLVPIKYVLKGIFKQAISRF